MNLQSTCCSPSELQDLLADRLPVAESERVRDHVRQCPACAERLDAVRLQMLPGTPETRMPTLLQMLTQEGSPPAASFDFLLPSHEPDELGWLAHYRVFRLAARGAWALSSRPRIAICGVASPSRSSSQTLRASSLFASAFSARRRRWPRSRMRTSPPSTRSAWRTAPAAKRFPTWRCSS